MSTTQFWTLGYFESILSVEVDRGICLDDAIGFLSSHFTWTPVDGPVDGFARLSVHPIAPGDERFAPGAGHWENIYVRKSASEFFTIPARRLRTNGVELIECTKTLTRFIFRPATASVDVQVGPTGQLDFVELVRDMVLKDQENRGSVVLHATTAYRPGSSIVVTGSKGAGKSTILLELVENFGYQIVSGDKTILRAVGPDDYEIAGWPDYPHLGYATIAKYEGLRSIAGLGDDHVPAEDHHFSPYGKYAVDPAGFRTRFVNAPHGLTCRPALVLHPNIGPGERTILSPLDDDPDLRAADLALNLESSFSGAHATWQTFSIDRTSAHRSTQDRVLRLLGETPAWELSGPGDLTPDNFGPLLEKVYA